jgi:hypothetical protein
MTFGGVTAAVPGATGEGAYPPSNRGHASRQRHCSVIESTEAPSKMWRFIAIR